MSIAGAISAISPGDTRRLCEPRIKKNVGLAASVSCDPHNFVPFCPNYRALRNDKCRRIQKVRKSALLAKDLQEVRTIKRASGTHKMRNSPEAVSNLVRSERLIEPVPSADGFALAHDF